MQFKVTPLFNQAFNIAYETGTPLVIEGKRYSQYMDGWKPGVPLKPSVLGTLTIYASNEQAAAAAVYLTLNRDDRANGQIEPSLSIGDVIVVSNHDSDIPYAVADIGFQIVNMFEVDEAIVKP